MIDDPFERLLQLEPVSPGRMSAELDPSWNTTVAPNGGILAALMVRAVEAQRDTPAPPVRTVSAQYLDAPGAGRLDLAIEPLRAGKRVAAYSVRITQRERLMVLATLICSASRPQPVELRASPPPLPPPDTVPVLTATGEEPLTFRHLEMRHTIGALPLSGAAEAVAGGWLALRDDDHPLDAARLTAMCDLWWPAVFPVLPARDAAPTLQLTVFLRDTGGEHRAPVLARFATSTVAEGHMEERGELWSASGQLLAESVQLALLVPLPN